MHCRKPQLENCDILDAHNLSEKKLWRSISFLDLEIF